MSLNQEGHILLATQSIKQGQSKSVQAAAILYNLNHRTLQWQIDRMPSQCDSIPNS